MAEQGEFGSGPVDPAEEVRKNEAVYRLKELEFRRDTEIKRQRLTYSISIAGLFVGVTFLVLQFYSFRHDRAGGGGIDFEWQGNNSAAVYEKLIDSQQAQIKLMQQQIDILQRQIQILQSSKPQPDKTIFTPNMRGISGINIQYSKDKQDNNSQEPVRRLPVFREYIFPSVYALLGVILVCSALFALSAKDKGRRDVAVEITKTLITFFIGAATGQA